MKQKHGSTEIKHHFSLTRKLQCRNSGSNFGTPPTLFSVNPSISSRTHRIRNWVCCETLSGVRVRPIPRSWGLSAKSARKYSRPPLHFELLVASCPIDHHRRSISFLSRAALSPAWQVVAAMAQIFTSTTTSSSGGPASPSTQTASNEKRIFPGLSKKHPESHFQARLRSFFRINSSSSKDNNATLDHHDSNKPEKSENKVFRQSRLFLAGVTRNRSPTVVSEGNPLEENVSPITQANPYFAHQGQPSLRHRNEGSVPSTPTDTPEIAVEGSPVDGDATTAGKEELARKLRRVASAPNAQGLLNGTSSDDRPRTAELGKEPVIVENTGSSPRLSMVQNTDGLTVPKKDSLAPFAPSHLRKSIAFRRTYSSNSTKVRNVEVGPGSFDKIKLIGKGDVGKVYLVREKKSSRLYAMKGTQTDVAFLPYTVLTLPSLEQKGDDQAKQNQAGPCRAGDSRDEQPSVYRYVIPFIPIRRSSLPLHGVLQRRRVL